MILNPSDKGNPLRGAIVGFGNVAMHAHLPVWRRNEHFTIAAVVEPHPERALKARRMLPEAKVYPSMEALLFHNGIDFVDICTPPRFHDDFVLAACQSDLHVFCEKPLTTSTERLVEIQDSAEKSGRVVFTVNNWKYAPLWVRARELVRENRIGAVRYISMNVLRCSSSGGGVSDWRKDPDLARGGIMIDHGWHN
ncbi:MAG: Gfo/Idh/MocA family oxidoreductase, partial [Syntrophobacteraceae bacterium]|nr:Gfo/Idh/MocA family oxidoreductase [Syntrophobacteraceae bacterium]